MVSNKVLLEGEAYDQQGLTTISKPSYQTYISLHILQLGYSTARYPAEATVCIDSWFMLPKQSTPAIECTTHFAISSFVAKKY